MTHPKKPSERSLVLAKEIFKYRFITDWQGDDPDGKRREMFIGNLSDDIAQALDQARREGWEAAKKKLLDVHANSFVLRSSQIEDLKYPEA